MLSSAAEHELRLRWVEEMPPGVAGTTDELKVWRGVVSRYSEAGRYYHTLEHVARVLATVEGLVLQGPVHDPAAIRLACWFHDVVYDPRATDNEEKSAHHAVSALRRLAVTEERIAAVQRLIRATRTHAVEPEDVDGAVLVDADLEILGAAPAEYDDYARAIRREYGWVPEAEYRAGRARILRRFLKRPRIYLTPVMWSRREEQARQNLAREVCRLACGASG